MLALAEEQPSVRMPDEPRERDEPSEANPVNGATAGALTAVWIVAALGIVYLFERRPLALFFINAGYFVVALPLMGVILGAWR